MKLSRKIITLILIAFGISVALIIIVSKSFLLSNFTTLEINKADSGVSRIMKYIDSDIDSLSTLSTSYAHWDDTYNFIKSHDSAYIDSTYSNLTCFSQSDCNFIIITDLYGNPAFIKSFNYTYEQYLSESEITAIAERITTIQTYDKVDKIKGVYMTSNGPLLISCQPVTDSRLLKNPDGYFILAKYLDNDEINLMSSIVGEKFIIHNYNAMHLLGSTTGSSSLIHINNSLADSITGYGTINDVFGQPALCVELSLPKDILIEANSNIHFFISLIAVIFIIFVMIILSFLDNYVLSRISTLQNKVNSMSGSQELSIGLEKDEGDEISELGEKFNNMYQQIQNTNQQLIKSEKKYSSLFSNMMSGFMYCKVTLDSNNMPDDFIILEVNNAFASMFEKSRDAIVNKLGLKLLPDELRSYQGFMQMITQVAIKGTASLADAFYYEKYDTWYYLTIYSTEKYHFAVMLTDITDKHNSQKKILNLAYYDELTNLPNRKKLMKETQRILDECSTTTEKLALLFVDLDNFKGINDSLGHEVGDYVLERTAARLKQLLDENVLLGRLGGDEFIIVLRNLTHASQAESLANRLHSLLKPVINYKGSELYVGASIGISIYPDDGVTLSNLMRNADTAMYAAKRSGGYCYELYSRGMNDFALTELIMEGNLRKALDNNEILVYYQPVVDLKTMKTVGAEALTRWKQNNNLVPPNQFIPLAKNIGVIVDLDNWVLRNACLQCKIWKDMAPENDFHISVNTSYKQIKEPDFVKTVIRACEDSGLEPGSLNLEITEDQAMEDVELIINVLSKLKAKGIGAAMDDFGTGYSSLSYVNRLPIDLLKIDRSLVNSIDKDVRSLEIARTIMVMSHSLGIRVLAEGVERESQLEILEQFKCDYIQGYIISKPVPAEEFEAKFL